MAVLRWERCVQRFECPRCSGQFQIETGMVGKQVACPHCLGHVQIPVSSQIEVEEESSGTAAGMQGLQDRIPAPPSIPHTTREKSPTEAASEEQPDSVSDTGEPLVPDPMAPVVSNAPVPNAPVLPVADVSEDDTSEYGFCPSAVVVESGTHIEVEEHPRTIIHKGRVIPLRRLTPEEKKRRRLRRSILLILISGTILLLWLLYGAGKI